MAEPTYPSPGEAPYGNELKAYIDADHLLFITQTGHALAVGDVIRFNGTDYVKAKADTAANAEVVGIVKQVVNPDNFVYQTSGIVWDVLSGLTIGTNFLSASTAGALTATEPSQISKPVVLAISSTLGVLVNMRGIVVNPLRIQIAATDPATVLTTGDGKAYFLVDQYLNGMRIVGVAAALTTKGTTLTTVQIRNVTQTADVLSTKLTIDGNESTSYTAAAAAVIDAAHDDLVTGDILAIDVDGAGSGAQGLIAFLAVGV